MNMLNIAKRNRTDENTVASDLVPGIRDAKINAILPLLKLFIWSKFLNFKTLDEFVTWL